MIDNSLKAKILAKNKSAQAETSAIKNDPTMTVSVLESHLRNYIMFSYSLCEEDMTTDDIGELATKSIAKIMNIDENSVDEKDVAGRCDGVTTRRKKKFLLLMSLQKELDFRFEAGSTADLETVSDLALDVRKHLG